MIDLLIVEDEALLADLLAEAAKLNGFNVQTARDGESALGILEALPQPPYFVLADVKMQPMDGLDFLRRLRAHPDWGKIYVISTSGTPDDEEAALAAGANYYLSKPFPIEEFITEMRKQNTEK
ncbi:MAG: two component transcriptional regulator [Chloroflexi bacterium OLB15]|nr:MAG: two component transcriptional regulator [Chloroflexi bacterium OLB15]